MSSAQLDWQANANLFTVPALGATADQLCWYAIQTRCRFEKKVATQLQNKGVETFLPLVKQVHRWSDRRQLIETPLFPGYGFVQLWDSPDFRLRVLQTPGVIGFVMMNNAPVPVPEEQLEHVRLLLTNAIACSAYPFLKVGQRVRIRSGCLDGLEGILISENKDHSLVISIEAIQRSVALRIEGYDVEPV